MQQDHRGSHSSSSAAAAAAPAAAPAAAAASPAAAPAAPAAPAGDASGSKNKSETAQWTDEEEVRFLRTALEIARESVESFDATVSPVERVRRAVGGDFTAKEIVEKAKQLRKRYEEMCSSRVRSSSSEADADVFGTAFEISDQIWGSRGRNKENEKGNGKEGDRNAA